MSHTDDTDPWWVQIRRMPKSMLDERHWHHGYFGTTPECDLDFPLPRTRRMGFKPCEYWFRCADYAKVLGRSRWRRKWGSFQDRRARADLRNLKGKWLKESDREEIDSTDKLPTNRWRWRRWRRWY